MVLNQFHDSKQANEDVYVSHIMTLVERNVKLGHPP